MNDPMFQPVTSEWAPEAKIPGSPRISRGTLLDHVNPSPEASMLGGLLLFRRRLKIYRTRTRRVFMGVPRKCGR